MIANSLDDFLPYLKSLWPGYRCDHEQIRVLSRWDDWLCHIAIETIQSALKQVRREQPNDTRPNWVQVFRVIHESGRGETQNDFRVFIDGLRRYVIEKKFPGCRDRTDQDLFYGYLEANCHTHRNGKLLLDPEGWRGPQAKLFRHQEGRRWTLYLQSIGEAVPDWLDTDRDDSVTGRQGPA